jgi:hypothetical protein
MYKAIQEYVSTFTILKQVLCQGWTKPTLAELRVLYENRCDILK